VKGWLAICYINLSEPHKLWLFRDSAPLYAGWDSRRRLFYFASERGFILDAFAEHNPHQDLGLFPRLHIRELPEGRLYCVDTVAGTVTSKPVPRGSDDNWDYTTAYTGRRHHSYHVVRHKPQQPKPDTTEQIRSTLQWLGYDLTDATLVQSEAGVGLWYKSAGYTHVLDSLELERLLDTNGTNGSNDDDDVLGNWWFRGYRSYWDNVVHPVLLSPVPSQILKGTKGGKLYCYQFEA